MSGFFEATAMRSVTAGTLLWRPPSPSGAPAHGASIDTRTIRPGQVFFALRGERVDGHAYLAAAAGAGASAAVVERGRVSASEARTLGAERMAVLEVADGRAALLAMARAYRRQLGATRVVAVTGSNGKTTTVRLLDQVLGASLTGSASIKSYNNELGVPLTILNAARGDHYLVCEVGMSLPGEIRKLAAVVRPDVAVVTSIGRAHLGGLGSTEAIAREKLSLFTELEPGGMAVAPEHPLVPAEPAPAGSVTLRVGSSTRADVRIGGIEAGPDGVAFTLNDRRRFRTRLLGRHNAQNAACAVAVAQRLGLDDAAIVPALAAAQGPPMRLDRREIAGVTVINDAYNANPESMVAAATALVDLTPGARRRVLVMGAMLELGEAAASIHAEIGSAIARLIADGRGPDAVVLVGRGAEPAAEPLHGVLGARGVRLVPGVGDGRWILGTVASGDALLLKGSRGIGLERLAGVLEEAERAQPAG
ncbi:MAG: UDP-N-acetylmuramoyl-tripeptide--D-alanyl-D-alanine ligase [Planctomycetota bacterium]